MPDRRYAEEELTKARQALTDAERLIETEGSQAGIVNRLYAVTCHAAQGALYARGVTPGSHGAVGTRFGEETVLENDATREQGRLRTTLAERTTGGLRL